MFSSVNNTRIDGFSLPEAKRNGNTFDKNKNYFKNSKIFVKNTHKIHDKMVIQLARLI